MKIFKSNNLIVNLVLKNVSFLKFCVVGVSNTILSLIIYWILNMIGINYLVSSTIAYLMGIFNGYMLSSRFVYNKKQSFNTGVKFFTVYGISLLLNLLIMYLLVEVILFDKMIAQAVAVIVNTFFNYIINSVWTFKK